MLHLFAWTIWASECNSVFSTNTQCRITQAKLSCAQIAAELRLTIKYSMHTHTRAKTQRSVQNTFQALIIFGKHTLLL